MYLINDRKTYINCESRCPEVIGIISLFGIVKVKWTNHTKLLGFLSFISLVMIPLTPLFMYGLGLLHIHPIVSFITIIGFWFIWTWEYGNRNIKTCRGYVSN